MFGGYGAYGQGGGWASIVEQIISYIQMGMELVETATALAQDIQTIINVKNDYEDAKEEAMDEGQSEREAEQTAKQTLVRGASEGTYTPVAEAKTPTWVYVAGGVAALALVGGGVYWLTRKKR